MDDLIDKTLTWLRNNSSNMWKSLRSSVQLAMYRCVNGTVDMHMHGTNGKTTRYYITLIMSDDDGLSRPLLDVTVPTIMANEYEEPRVTGCRAVLAKSVLTISLVILISARCVDRALFTRITYALPDYLWYLANIVLPIAFLVISWPVVWYKMYFTG